VITAGPPSEVRLDTTYLDSRIRISRGGSSGTPFVFTDASAKPDVHAWRVVGSPAPPSSRRAQPQPVSARAIGKALVAAGGVVGAASRVVALQSPAASSQAVLHGPTAAAAAVLLVVGAKFVSSTGGIVVSADSKQKQKSEQASASAQSKSA
jgi:hypothetical protein